MQSVCYECVYIDLFSLDSAVVAEEETLKSLKEILDDDSATCVNTTQLLASTGHFTGWLKFKGKLSKTSISLKITWDSDIDCTKRKVLSMISLKDNVHNIKVCIYYN